jgi:hypothetical protein
MIDTVDVARTIDVSSGKAWAVIRAIGGLERWFPVIATCRVEGEGVGAIRILGLGDGGEIRDRILEIDDATRRLRYLRIQHPFPVRSYEGTVVVRDVGNGRSELVWSVAIDVDEEAHAAVAAFLREALSDGLAGLDADLRAEPAG